MRLTVDKIAPAADRLPKQQAAERGIAAVQTMGRQLGIPHSLKDLGVNPADFATMAENAQKDVCSLTNPRTATKEQIIEVFSQAYEGI